MEEIFGFCLTPPARLTRRAVLGAACLLAASLGQAQPAAAPESPKAPVRFVALGDMPYGDPAPYLELIGQINLFDDYSTVELPELPADVLDVLKRTRVKQVPLKIRAAVPGEGDKPTFAKRRPASTEYSKKPAPRGERKPAGEWKSRSPAKPKKY